MSAEVYSKAQLDAIAAIVGDRISQSRVRTKIFQGTPATGQNIHGATNAEANIGWVATTNNASFIDSFSNSDNQIIAVEDDVWRIQASIGALNSAVNNRSTYIMIIDHFDSSDSQIDQYFYPSAYIRDDNDTYDSGVMGGFIELPVSAGDKIIVCVKVLEVQTAAGTVDPNNAYSQITIFN